MVRSSLNLEVEQLRREINDLNLLLNKLVTTNINVQSKVTESIIKQDDLIKSVKSMVDLLHVATEMESGSTTIDGIDELVMEVKEMNQKLGSTEEYMKKLYRRMFVISKSGSSEKKEVPSSSLPNLSNQAINKLKSLGVGQKQPSNGLVEENPFEKRRQQIESKNAPSNP